MTWNLTGSVFDLKCKSLAFHYKDSVAEKCLKEQQNCYMCRSTVWIQEDRYERHVYLLQIITIQRKHRRKHAKLIPSRTCDFHLILKCVIPLNLEKQSFIIHKTQIRTYGLHGQDEKGNGETRSTFWLSPLKTEYYETHISIGSTIFNCISINVRRRL